MPDTRYVKVAVVVVALALVASAVGASGVTVLSHTADSQTQDTSYFRIAHASPDAPAVNVTVGNDTVAENVSFGEVTDYVNTSAGTYNVTISAADDPATVVFEGNVTVEPREVVTIAATGEISTTNAEEPFEPVVLSDDAFTPDDDEAAVSVVHFSPDAPNVDVVATETPDEEAENETETPAENETETPAENETETPAENETETPAENETVLAENVSFQNASEYVNVPEGNYTVEIRVAAPDNDGDTVATVNLSVEGGTAYSVVAAGYVTPEDSPEGEAFTVYPVEDATKTLEFPGEEEETPEGEAENETETPEEEEEETPEGEEEETPEEETPEEETPEGEEEETPEETPEGTPAGTPGGTPTVAG